VSASPAELREVARMSAGLRDPAFVRLARVCQAAAAQGVVDGPLALSYALWPSERLAQMVLGHAEGRPEGLAA
jgi:hypothetical protein